MADSTLFCDVDGVLNRFPNGGLESAKVELLYRILLGTGCDVVLCSSWRNNEEQRQRIVKVLARVGRELSGVTPTIPGSGRSDEIISYLGRQSLGRFAVLDDETLCLALTRRQVKTDRAEGLTLEQAEEVCRLLGGVLFEGRLRYVDGLPDVDDALL